MTIRTALNGTLVVVALTTFSVAYAGETDKEKALKDGAHQLTADEIAERFANKTATFVPPSGDKEFLIYYGKESELAGKQVGGDWSATGYYGISDDNTICLSWQSDKGRLACRSVLVKDGDIKKYKVDGSLLGSITKLEEGKTF